MYCNNCGEKIEEGSGFCNYCGAKILSDVKTNNVINKKSSHIKNKNEKFGVGKIVFCVALLLLCGVTTWGGFRTKSRVEGKPSFIRQINEYELDNNKQLIYLCIGDESSLDTELVFNEFGEICNWEEKGEQHYKKILDTKGRLVEEIYDDLRFEYTYYESGDYEWRRYDDSNELTELRKYDANGGLEKSFDIENDLGILTLKNTYDELGRLKYATSIREDGTQYLSVDYSYDQFGNLISTKFFNGDEDYISKGFTGTIEYPCSDHTYTYDDNNLLIGWKDEYYKQVDGEWQTSYREGQYEYEYNTLNQVVGYTYREQYYDEDEYDRVSYEYNQDGKIIKVTHDYCKSSVYDDKTKEYPEGVTFESIKPAGGDGLYFADNSYDSLYGRLGSDFQYKPKAINKFDWDVSTYGIGTTHVADLCPPCLSVDQSMENSQYRINTNNKRNISWYYKDCFDQDGNRTGKKQFTVIKRSDNIYREYIFEPEKVGLWDRLVYWLVVKTKI